jgi:hypothetical protein
MKTKSVYAHMRLHGLSTNYLDYIILNGVICGVEEISEVTILDRSENNPVFLLYISQ